MNTPSVTIAASLPMILIAIVFPRLISRRHEHELSQTPRATATRQLVAPRTRMTRCLQFAHRNRSTAAKPVLSKSGSIGASGEIAGALTHRVG